MRQRQVELLWADEHICAVTSYEELNGDCYLDVESRRGRFPEIRRLFGDKPVATVIFARESEVVQGDLDRIAKAFPEAYVFIAEPDYCPMGFPVFETDDE